MSEGCLESCVFWDFQTTGYHDTPVRIMAEILNSDTQADKKWAGTPLDC